MKYLLLFSMFFLQLDLSAQDTPPVHEYYSEIFEISREKYEDREYLRREVKELGEGHPLAPIVNNNRIFLDYWLINFVDSGLYSRLAEVEDNEELREEFLTSLKKDSSFDPLMARFSERALNPAFVPDTVSMDEVLNVAVKYFNIQGITEEGSYKGKVCSGLNGITQTLKERRPALEAFCFSAILQNLRGEEYNMYKEFVAAIKELYRQDLGVDRDERLLRAQGAMFSLMRNNTQLKKMLLADYEKRKNFLPFVIAQESKTEKS